MGRLAGVVHGPLPHALRRRDRSPGRSLGVAVLVHGGEVIDALAAKTADVVSFLQRRGETVTVLRSNDPGFITYEDRLQVAAELH